MKDSLLFIVSLGLFLLPAAVAFVRARTELESGDRISPKTFVAALFAYTALAAGVVLGSALNAWPMPLIPWVSRSFGAILLLFGAAMYLTARLQLRSFRETWGLRTDRLITTGIYGLLRHPQNLGWGFLLAGIALLGRSGVALAMTGTYVLTCLIWLPVEEAFLERRFGSIHLRYRSQIPALIRLFARWRTR